MNDCNNSKKQSQAIQPRKYVRINALASEFVSFTDTYFRAACAYVDITSSPYPLIVPL